MATKKTKKKAPAKKTTPSKGATSKGAKVKVDPKVVDEAVEEVLAAEVPRDVPPTAKQGPKPDPTGKATIYYYDPDDLEIVLDPAHRLYDLRGENDPDPDLVASMRRQGNLEPVIVASMPGYSKPCVVDGRQRVIAARAINVELRKARKPLMRVKALVEKDPAELELIAAGANVHVESTPLQKADMAARLHRMGHSPAEICIAMGCTAPTLEGWMKLRGASKETKKALQQGKTTATEVLASQRANREPRQHRPKERHHMSIKEIRTALAVAKPRAVEGAAPGVAMAVALLEVIAGHVKLENAPAEVRWLLAPQTPPAPMPDAPPPPPLVTT